MNRRAWQRFCQNFFDINFLLGWLRLQTLLMFFLSLLASWNPVPNPLGLFKTHRKGSSRNGLKWSFSLSIKAALPYNAAGSNPPFLFNVWAAAAPFPHNKRPRPRRLYRVTSLKWHRKSPRFWVHAVLSARFSGYTLYWAHALLSARFTERTLYWAHTFL